MSALQQRSVVFYSRILLVRLSVSHLRQTSEAVISITNFSGNIWPKCVNLQSAEVTTDKHTC